MSMITGCPACGTLFKVVPDQLKISDGWVRCGHCSEVFDASAHLRDPAVDSEAAALQTAPAPLDVEASRSHAPTQPAPLTPAPTVAPPPTAVPAPEAATSVLPSRFSSDAIEVRETTHSQIDAEPAPRSRLPPEIGYSLPVDSMFVRESQASRPHIEMLDEEDDYLSLDHPDLDDVSFVRAARRKVFWRRPGVRLALGVLGLALAVLLAAQVAVHERDRLAALHPDWKPALQLLCKPSACKVGPLRRIEAIVIDSSGFSRVRQDAYRLGVTLKNQAAQPVAVPALELTLTDTQDQPLLRRVLLPRDIGATAETVPASSDWSTTVTVAVTGGGPAAKVAGYRLLAFYP